MALQGDASGMKQRDPGAGQARLRNDSDLPISCLAPAGHRVPRPLALLHWESLDR